MDKLTFEGNFCDIAMCREIPCPYDGACSQKKVWERLKAYEDTGLTPEICDNYRQFEDEAISHGVTFKRIVELMKADVAPVVHGRWEWLGPYRYNNDGSIGTCSVCHNRTRIFYKRNYRPNCGAKMDLENDYE